MSCVNSRFCLDRLQFGHVVAGDVALLLGGLRPGEPPVALGVVDDLEVFSFLETQVLVSPGVVVVQGHEHPDLDAGLDRVLCGVVRQWPGSRPVVQRGPAVESGQLVGVISRQAGHQDSAHRVVWQSGDACREEFNNIID